MIIVDPLKKYYKEKVCKANHINPADGVGYRAVGDADGLQRHPHRNYQFVLRPARRHHGADPIQNHRELRRLEAPVAVHFSALFLSVTISGATEIRCAFVMPICCFLQQTCSNAAPVSPKFVSGMIFVVKNVEPRSEEYLVINLITPYLMKAKILLLLLPFATMAMAQTDNSARAAQELVIKRV